MGLFHSKNCHKYIYYSENTNRKIIGIELEEKYFNIAKNRIEEAQNKKEIE